MMNPFNQSTAWSGIMLPVSAKPYLNCSVSVILLTFLLAETLSAEPAADALPIQGQVIAGQASITQQQANMTVTQSSDKAIIDWQSFNIGKQAHVDYQQPGSQSVTLNRVLSHDPSQIYGRLTANGQVYLVNPNGVLFAPGSQVDVGGMVATTQNISNEDFLAGKNTFSRNGAQGSIVSIKVKSKRTMAARWHCYHPMSVIRVLSWPSKVMWY